MTSIEIRAGRESKPHIGIYGRCNAGKSTLLNFITGGAHAVVSAVPGTTTDPVHKSCEIPGFAPVVFIDTAGLDDPSPLGQQRIRKTGETLARIDLALLVFRTWGAPEETITERFRQEEIPFLPILNVPGNLSEAPAFPPHRTIDLLHAGEPEREALLQAIAEALPEHSYVMPSLFEGLAQENDTVVLVCPIDSGAPAGRMILPQVQAIRHLLDRHAVALVVQPEQLAALFAGGLRPKLVVTDSQAFARVRAVVPEGIGITSFSILLARSKGDIEAYTAGLARIDALRPGDRVLILENCLHHAGCEDIGRVGIPRLLERKAGGKLHFTVVSGLSALPDDLAEYALAVQCGGCMVTRRQVQGRIRAIRNAGVAVTNYGMLLSAES